MPDFNMGEYGAYVWPAWGISALVLAALVWSVLGKARKAKRALDEAEGRDPS
jgi:heme exporter protein D